MRRFNNYSKPKAIKGVLEDYLDFRDARICRGMVLRIWKDKVCKVAGGKHWLDDLDRAWLTGETADRESDGFCNPALVIKMTPGSMWIPELYQRRYQIMQRINERIDREFIRSVRVK